MSHETHGTHDATAIAIRPATPVDVDRLVEIENRAFTSDRIARRSFRRYLRGTTCAMIVATIEQAIAGYALVAFRRTSRKARINSLAVDTIEGRGVGQTLLRACERTARGRHATSIHLEVDESNARAIRLYERLHYQRIGRREDYYENGAAALLFEKPLA